MRTRVLILLLSVIAFALAVNAHYADSADLQIGSSFAILLVVLTAMVAIFWPNGSPISLSALRPQTAYRLHGQLLIPARGSREERYLFFITDLKEGDELVCISEYPFEGATTFPTLVTCAFRHNPREKSGYCLLPLK